MSIEAVAAAAGAKEVIGNSAVEAAGQLAEKMSVSPEHTPDLTQQQLAITESFNSNELNAPECSNIEKYKKHEEEAAEDLKGKFYD